MNKLLILLIASFHLTAFSPQSPISFKPDEVELSQLDRQEIECLADNVYHEARGEPQEGMLAVALVTMNRLAHKGFGNTLCKVVYQRTNGFCQFSWVCQKVKVDRKSELYEEIYDLAEETYLNYYTGMVDITKSSLFFHATSVNPGWNLVKTVQLGRHIFYRNKGENVQKSNKIVGGRV